VASFRFAIHPLKGIERLREYSFKISPFDINDDAAQSGKQANGFGPDCACWTLSWFPFRNKVN
jgi:hypothetical protein